MLRRPFFFCSALAYSHPGAVLAAFVLAMCLLGGCNGTAPGEPAARRDADASVGQEAFRRADGTRAAALRVLDSLKRGAIRNASSHLGGRSYTRRVPTEQIGETGRVTAFQERLLRYGPSRARVVRSDSSGAFDFGALGRMVKGTGLASTGAGTPATDLTRQVLPDEPAFLSRRNRHAFTYRLLPDTTLAGGPARVVAVRARPSTDGDRQTVRSARLYIDAATGQLLGVHLHRVRRSLLFDEDTRQRVHIRPASGRTPPPDSAAAWVPAETHFETQLDVPLRPARHVRSTASYSYSATSS
jgi:hypothetical protein